MTKTHFRDAMQQALQIVKQHPIVGLRPSSLERAADTSSAFIKYERMRGLEFTLGIRFDLASSDGDARPKVTVNFPCTEHSVASAVAFAAMLTEVNQLAALVQAHLDALDITFREAEVTE
jgi:hypothetical protein